MNDISKRLQAANFIRDAAKRVVLARFDAQAAAKERVLDGRTNNEMWIAGLNMVAKANEDGFTIVETYVAVLAALAEMQPYILELIKEMISIASNGAMGGDSDEELTRCTKTLDMIESIVLMAMLTEGQTDRAKAQRERIKEGVAMEREAQARGN